MEIRRLLSNKKMCKIMILFACLTIVSFFFVSQVYAEMSENTEETIIASGKSANADWVLDSNGILTISGDRVSMYNYDQNTTFAPWREYSEQIKKIIIQDGVTSIGDHAFYDCKNATEIEIGNTVTVIGKFALNGSFTSIDIPASVTDINQYAFLYSQGKLIRYTVSPDNMYYSSDEKGVLFDKEKTELLRAPDCLEGTYTVPESVLKIQGAFDSCRQLTNLIIGDNVNYIDSAALRGCSSLQTLYVGDGITSFGQLFENSTGLDNLTTITIGKGLSTTDGRTTINVFNKLKVLKEINVCQENEVFASVDGILYNKEMTQLIACPRGRTGSFQVPDGITKIGTNAFFGSSLTEITVPDSVVEMDGFQNSSNLKRFVIPDGVGSIPQFCFSGCVNLKAIYVSESLKAINQNAFAGCSSLTEITFPVGLKSIDRTAFEGCVELSKITFKGGYPGSIDSTAFSGVTAVCYYPGNILTWTDDVKTNYGGTLTWVPYEVDQFEGQEHTFTVPGTNITLAYKIDGEKNTASIVLCNSDAVGDLEIPEVIDGYTVADIADSAFKECVGLTSVTIPTNVKTIGCSAFNGCTKMTSVNIPENITVIAEYAFANCGLTSIAIPNSVVEIASCAFKNTKISHFIIPESVSVIGAGAFSSNQNLTEVVLPDGLTYIAESMFQGCPCLLDVNFPDTLVSIRSNAFYGCYGLNSVVLPEGLISIGSNAFALCGAYDLYHWYYDCNNFTSVTLPSTLKTIGESAFIDCRSLTSIDIPDGVTVLERGTFAQCRRLTTVTISSNITSIGESAFHQCLGLTQVTFKWSAPVINAKVFSNDMNLTAYYPSNNEKWTSDLLQNYGAKTLTWVAQEMEKPAGGAGGGEGSTGEGGSGGGGTGEGTGEGSGSDSGSGEGSGSGGSGEGEGSETGGSSGESGESGSGTGSGIKVIVNISGESASGITVTEPECGWTEGSNTFTVSCEHACVVAVSYDGGTNYIKLNAEGFAEGHKYTAADMTSDTILGIILAGDVNSDGTLTNADVTRLRAAFLGKTDLDAMQFLAADLNGDASVTNADATKLSSIILGKAEADW